MAGAHIEREARYEQTGMTELQRDQMIMQLRRRGWKQKRIANELGMTQQAISLAIKRLTGKPRRQAKRAEFDDGMECEPIPPPVEW